MVIIEYFFKLVAPHDCLLCGDEGRLLCRQCANTRLIGLPERCYRCYRLSPLNKTCPTCRHHSVIKNTWIRTQYNEQARQIIYALKFTHAKDAAVIIAGELFKVLPVLSSGTIITHVPAATSHVRRRGFDQSALIARELARLTGLRHITTLVRTGQQRQVGSARETRQRQMRSVFRPIASTVIKESNILLVDDVLTTGSTIESAALTLKAAGAKSIASAIFAQAR